MNEVKSRDLISSLEVDGLETTPAAVSDLADKIFELLGRKGDLCVSQISVELGTSVNRVRQSLVTLENEGVVEAHPDRDRSRNWTEEEVPWGLSRLR